MDTLFIIRDSITFYAGKVIDSCQPCIQEAETNCKDVTIVAIICLTILILSSIITYALYLNKKENEKANNMIDGLKEEIDKLEKALKKEQENNSPSTNALELLKGFVSLSKGKDEKIDLDTIDKLYDIHIKIKESIKEDKVQNDQESEHEKDKKPKNKE